jgi:hypothetical protein
VTAALFASGVDPVTGQPVRFGAVICALFASGVDRALAGGWRPSYTTLAITADGPAYMRVRA